MSLNGLLLANVVTYDIYIIQRYNNVHIASYFYWIIIHAKVSAVTRNIYNFLLGPYFAKFHVIWTLKLQIL